MYFGFALELSNIDLLNIDLSDTNLDLLDTDILSKYFACLHNVFKTSSRHVFKTSSRHVFKTSWRSLQHDNFSSDVFKTSWKTKNCYAKDVSKTKTCSTTKWCYPRLKSWQIALPMSIMKIQMIYTNTLEAPILICIKEMLQKTNCPTQKTA